MEPRENRRPEVRCACRRTVSCRTMAAVVATVGEFAAPYNWSMPAPTGCAGRFTVANERCLAPALQRRPAQCMSFTTLRSSSFMRYYPTIILRSPPDCRATRRADKRCESRLALGTRARLVSCVESEVASQHRKATESNLSKHTMGRYEPL